MPNMACLLYYVIIKQAFQEAFTFKRDLNKGIHSSPSEVISYAEFCFTSVAIKHIYV